MNTPATRMMVKHGVPYTVHEYEYVEHGGTLLLFGEHTIMDKKSDPDPNRPRWPDRPTGETKRASTFSATLIRSAGWRSKRAGTTVWPAGDDGKPSGERMDELPANKALPFTWSTAMPKRSRIC